MWFVYRPESGEREEWWFDPNKTRSQEAEAIERRTGWDWAEFGQHLMSGSVLARRALLWTFQKRVHHTLRFEDVDFAVGEVELEYSADELEHLRDAVAEQSHLTRAERESALAELAKQIDQARPGPGKAPASGGA